MTHVALVGCGKMGQAMLRGWLASGLDAQYTVVDPKNRPDDLSERVQHACSPKDIRTPNIVFFAVKPQVMDAVCSSWLPYVDHDTVILSIAAGKSISFFQNHFGEHHPIIRAMPNTPAAIGNGITVAVSNGSVLDYHRSLAQRLLEVTGTLEWIKDETLMHAVTAVSGSGPAYLFHFTEALRQAAIDIGLPEQLASNLARETVIGSAALLNSDSDITPAQRRIDVTSPGGTTEAGLEILMSGMTDLLKETVNAAYKRGQSLD